MALRSAAISLLALISFAAPARGERLPAKVFTTADGLANNVVNRIVGDSRGYLWFCTREGLSRFDGHGFTTYGIDDGLPSAVIHDLIETRQGIYWIATGKGLVRFDPLGAAGPATDAGSMFSTFLPDADPRTHEVLSLLLDRGGTVWVGTGLGLYQVNQAAGAPSFSAPIDVERYEVTSLAEDSTGALWVGTGNGVYRRLANGRLEHYTVRDGLPANDVQTILADRHGRVWIGTRSNGLAVLTVDSGSPRPTSARVYSTRDGLPANWINQIFEARDGGLWAASTAGLIEIVPVAEAGGYRFRTLALPGARLARTSLGSPGPASGALGRKRHGCGEDSARRIHDLRRPRRYSIRGDSSRAAERRRCRHGGEWPVAILPVCRRSVHRHRAAAPDCGAELGLESDGPGRSRRGLVDWHAHGCPAISWRCPPRAARPCNTGGPIHEARRSRC